MILTLLPFDRVHTHGIFQLHSRRLPKNIDERHRRYNKYLEENRGRFLSGAFEFAEADWLYNPEDHRCPHDSWIESLEVFEKANACDIKIRTVEIKLTLLGAYHGGRIEIVYSGVTRYNISFESGSNPYAKAHSDWLIDEIRLSESGAVIHEIEFWRDAKTIIECEDLRYSWIPFEVTQD